MPDDLRARAEDLIAIHSAELGYAPDGVYGDNEVSKQRSMRIRPSEKAREKQDISWSSRIRRQVKRHCFHRLLTFRAL